MLNQAREDITLCRELIDMIKQTNDSFDTSMKNITNSVAEFNNTMPQSMTFLIHSLSHQPQPQPQMFAPSQTYCQTSQQVPNPQVSQFIPPQLLN